MTTTRRDLLKSMLLGAGGLGLRGLVAGLPASLIADRAAAQTADVCYGIPQPGAIRPQKMILITSASGDPSNANVPGTYVDGIYHPNDVTLGNTTYRFATGTVPTVAIGAGTYQCADPWATLVNTAGLGPRTCFFHHGTYTVAHGDHAKVNQYMGAIRRDQMLCALLANRIHTCYAPPTTQAAPVLLADNLIRYQGAVLPVLDRGGLATILRQPSPTSTDGRLRALRDGHQAALRDLLAQTATPAQQTALDGYVKAQTDARAVDQTLITTLGSPPGNNEQQRLNSVAAALLAMNLSPVVVMRYSFGGDNHTDGGLYGEASSTVQSVADLIDLWQKLAARGLQDDVTIVVQNVFGRTLGAAARSGNTNGRDHNAGHHCTVIIGAGFQGSVIGGVTHAGADFRADGLDSRTGTPTSGGDVAYEGTLASLGKTLCVGMGLTRAVVDDQITSGRVVEAALVPALRAA